MRNDAIIFYTFILFVLNLRPFQNIYSQFYRQMIALVDQLFSLYASFASLK